MVFCSGSQGLGRRRPSPGSSVDPAHRAFCCTLTSTSSDLCVCMHTEAHVPTYRRPDALSYTHSAHLSSRTHSDTQSPTPTPCSLGHWDPIGGTLSSSWGGPLPTPETARKERLTGGGQVCTDTGTALLKVSGKAVTRQGHPEAEEQDEGGPSGQATSQ